MIAPKFIPVVMKQVWRHRTRSILTAAGVAIAMFLFVTVQALQEGVHAATRVTSADTTLVVYRENRFCPATSRLPAYYTDRIARISGVESVLPIKIVVNNCSASLDVVTFRGVPPDQLPLLTARWRVTTGSLGDWSRRSDAAIVGERLALRRGLAVGDSLVSSGVSVVVAAIISSEDPQDQNVAYVGLEFLQQSASRREVGIVTQFNVKVNDPEQLEAVAKAIDDEFRSEPEPTQTRPEKAFIAQAGSDVVEIVGFTRYLAWGCLAAVLALVANAIVMSVRDRVKEHAVLQTLGFRGSLIARLIIVEGLVLGILGGTLGTIAATLVVQMGNFSLSNEGMSVNVTSDPSVIISGFLIAAGVGLIASLYPAWTAGRTPIAQSFRAV